MSRVFSLLIIFFLLVSCESKKPNILLIMVDDLGKEWVSAYGSQSIKTPNIDNLAKEGVLFHNVYSMPQCTPSRLTLLTGQYPYRHGWINHWDVPRWGGGIHYDSENNPSLGKVIKEAGYKTAVAGKWQVNDFRVQPDALMKHGFDDWLMWTGYEGGNPPSGKRYWDPYLFSKSGSKTYESKFGPDLFVNFINNFITENKENPWFVYFPMALTHPPLVPTPDKRVESDNLNDRHKPMVEYMDKLVGKLIDHIEELGLLENTVLIFTTDNGTSRGIKGDINGRGVSGAKAMTTEPGICNPFIIRYPPTGKGIESDALIDFTDIYPTLAEIAGGNTQAQYKIDGRSFASLLKGDSDDSERDWILSMGGQNRAKLSDEGVENEWVYRDRVLRDKIFKLYIGTNGQPAKFIDLRADSLESQNLLNRELSPEANKSFKKLVEVSKTFPEKDSDPRYYPLPQKDWYREVQVKSEIWKKGNN